MNYDYIQKPDIDLLIRAALDAGATVSKTRFGEKGGIFINGRRLEEGELEELLVHPKPQTNADRIRSMSDEELAEWIERIRMLCANDACGRACPLTDICLPNAVGPTETINWLKQEAE